MVPSVALPPVIPLTDQVTAVFPEPLTAAKNAWVVPNGTLALKGVTATVTGGGGLTKEMVAEAKLAGLATEVARTVTVLDAGRLEGAV